MAKKRKLEEIDIVATLSGEEQVEAVEPAEEPVTSISAGSSEDVINLAKAQTELKTRRVQLVLKPSVYKKAQRIAKKHGISVNEYISILLEADIAKREA